MTSNTYTPELWEPLTEVPRLNLGDYQLPVNGVNISDTFPFLDEPYWHEQYLDMIGQAGTGPMHSDAKPPSAVPVITKCFNITDLGIAWLNILDEWDKRCTHGYERDPSFTWRGYRTVMQKEGSYFGLLIECLNKLDTTSGVALSWFLPTLYWGEVRHKALWEPVEQLNPLQDPEFTVYQPYLDDPWAALLQCQR